MPIGALWYILPPMWDASPVQCTNGHLESLRGAVLCPPRAGTSTVTMASRAFQLNFPSPVSIPSETPFKIALETELRKAKR